MTRDFCYYFEQDIQTVFNAFERAAYEKFGKDCKKEGVTFLQFGLNASFKYNMNGGYMQVYLMPYKTGTAVNFHYVIIQLMGARCEAHARDLLNYSVNILGISAYNLNIEPEQFESYHETTKNLPQNAFCIACGKEIERGSAFCPNCGASQTIKNACKNCGREFVGDEIFCPSCGTKRN